MSRSVAHHNETSGVTTQYHMAVDGPEWTCAQLQPMLASDSTIFKCGVHQKGRPPSDSASCSKLFMNAPRGAMGDSGSGVAALPTVSSVCA